MIKKFLLLITSAAICATLSGCATVSNFDPTSLFSLGSAGTAGYIGYEATKNESRDTQMATTALAATGAYIAMEMLRKDISKSKRKEFMAGYNLGRSNRTKQQYWAIQRLSEKGEFEEQTTYRTYAFPALTNVGNVNYMPHSVIMRTTE